MTTILLIEGETTTAKVITRALEKHGYSVVHAGDGQAALRLHAQVHPDLVLLDWVIPAPDSPEMLRRLRQISSTPVVILIASRSEIDSASALTLGADDFIPKPFSMPDLVARVRTHLRRVERVQRIVNADRVKDDYYLTYQDLSLCPDLRQVTVAGQPVDLTPTEFDLLYLLLRNPGRVFSRAYLLELVEQKENAVCEGPVENAILHLRKKLCATGERIETVLGIGYRFNHPL